MRYGTATPRLRETRPTLERVTTPSEPLVRPFAPDDAAEADRLLREAFSGFEAEFPGSDEAVAAGTALLAQTGSSFLVAETSGQVEGVVRWWRDEGVTWFDLLVCAYPWGGHRLIAAVEARAQDAGNRLVRLRAPGGGVLEEYFGRAGYLPVMRHGSEDAPQVTMEKRVPLLTVREQRRSDASAIAALTGEDPWPFEQGHRPGWFVLADGERVTGAIAVRDAGNGVARMRGPWLADGYRGRSLELWMAERGAQYAETNGHVAAELPAAGLKGLQRDFEDRRWFVEERPGEPMFVKRLDHGHPAPHEGPDSDG